MFIVICGRETEMLSVYSSINEFSNSKDDWVRNICGIIYGNDVNNSVLAS
jgi:hypothetical protein